MRAWSACLVGVLLLIAAASRADVIWDSTFDEPSLLGQTPPTTGPPDFPTFIRIGGGHVYTVVASLGSLTSQPVEITETNKFGVPKIRWDLETAGLPTITEGSVLLEFDMLVDDVPGVDDCVTSGQPIRCQAATISRTGSFGIVSIQFFGDGMIRLTSSLEPPVYSPLPYTVGVHRHFTVLVELDPPGGFTVWTDGELLGTVGWGAETPNFDGISFSGFLDWDLYAVDNIFIEQDPQLEPECSDGLDNDGDTLIDFPADPGCFQAWSQREERQCDDGVDNDSDMLIDFPADPGCGAAWDASEGSGACGVGAELVLVLLCLRLARLRARP